VNIRTLDGSTLETNLKQLLGDERKTLVEFLLHLAEIDRRRWYERKGYTSLWQYCRRELRLSESQAFYRYRAARLLRRCPAVAGYLEDGRICLSAVPSLDDVITAENATSVLDRASDKTRQQILELVAELAPRPAPVTSVIRAIPALPEPAASESAVPAETGAGAIGPEASMAFVAATEAPRSATVLRTQPPAAEAVPYSAELFRIHFTADKVFLEKLERAKNALSHSILDGDLKRVFEKGLDLILAQEAKKHDPAAVKPKTRPYALLPASSGRYIPPDLVRQVWARDGGCCSWQTATGRCGSKHQLEIDHILPLALGGQTVLSNLRLVCREHNRMAARQAFGGTFIESKIEARRAQEAAVATAAEGAPESPFAKSMFSLGPPSR
jgi:hypothetical protein